MVMHLFPEPPGIERFDTNIPQHVYPADDPKIHIVHNLSPCWCEPHIKGKIIIHRYSDKREYDYLAKAIYKEWLQK